MDYVSFSDESYTERYKSIATFSCASQYIEEVNSQIKFRLQKEDIKEFKWQKLRDFRYKNCANDMISLVFDFVDKIDARIDVIIWDTHDSRHNIQGRDDRENYAIMFYRLHSHSLRQRPKMSNWKLFPDEGVGVNWEDVNKIVNANGKKCEVLELKLNEGFIESHHFKISELTEVKSHDEPCCQIADLFAGLSIFSLTHFDRYKKWEESANSQLTLFQLDEIEYSNAEKNRFPPD